MNLCMKRIFMFLGVMLFFLSSVLAQSLAGFQTAHIGKQVKEFSLDSINLSSPLDYYLSRAWVMSSGKRKHWTDISTFKFSFDNNAPDEKVSDASRSRILNEYIDSIVSYRDSVAIIVTHNMGEPYIFCNYCWIEDGRWVNGGQGLVNHSAEISKELQQKLLRSYANLKRLHLIRKLPASAKPFADFLGQVTQSPEAFLFDMLKSHKLVINGEYHRRKVSWDMLKRLIALPGFADVAGAVFMELPSWCQPKMDAFMRADKLCGEMVLDIFREEQIYGWWDRGEYEFLCSLWHLNHRLPEEKRIKVVLADFQLPFSRIASHDEFVAEDSVSEDRNTHMADVICKWFAEQRDFRSALFLVGCAHAYKTSVPGIASAPDGMRPSRTAGAQLAERLGMENVFTVFQHVLTSDNGGNNKSLIRGGVFDKAFELNGNRAVGFALKDSPFGKEPFDGIYEMKFDAEAGTYADNFDGYLFLHPLADEPKAIPLTEVFSDKFVEEMKRRARYMGNGERKGIWFGFTADELTKEYIVETLLEED